MRKETNGYIGKYTQERAEKFSNGAAAIMAIFVFIWLSGTILPLFLCLVTMCRQKDY